MNRALLEGLLVGLDYPAGPQELAAYAREHGAPDDVVDALAGLPEAPYATPNDVGESLAPVDPERTSPEPPPRSRVGPPPGGDAYADG